MDRLLQYGGEAAKEIGCKESREDELRCWRRLLDHSSFDRCYFVLSSGQLMGMNEITEKLTLEEKCQGEHAVVQRVTTAANLSRVPCGSDKECR